MPPAKRVLTCKSNVKDEKTLKVTVCGLTLVSDGIGGYRCPNRAEHMMTYPTGFCQNKDCEGSARRSRSGRARPTCKWWKLCPCKCHETYDMMFGMAEMERQIVDNSGYAPETNLFKMPTFAERAAASASFTATQPDTPPVIESPAPDYVPPTLARTFAPTPSGRAARGELATWVKTECDIWVIDQPGYHCTPPYVAEHIAKTQGFGRPPSVGAVDAVFKRWEAVGFAVIERKPTRFVKYTEDGVKLGLEGCIERAKREKKSQLAEAGRSFHR